MSAFVLVKRCYLTKITRSTYYIERHKMPNEKERYDEFL